MNRLKDRTAAGLALANQLLKYQNQAMVHILALPRGGVPVAFEISKALHQPMHVFLVRKLGVPGHAELAMGAIAEGDVRTLNHNLIQQLKITERDVQYVTQHEQKELSRRLKHYRQGKPLPSLKGITIILVDDGLATGSTFETALLALKTYHPAKIVAAIPVASQDGLAKIDAYVDQTICLATPEPFCSVGQWYEDFEPVGDDVVLNTLRR